MNPRQLEKVTDELETDIRDGIEEWLMVMRASSDNCSLHVPRSAVHDDADATTPLCERTTARRQHSPHANHDKAWKRKPTAVYPRGYKQICRYCATEWEENE